MRSLVAGEPVVQGCREQVRPDPAIVEMGRLAGKKKDQHQVPLEAQSLAEMVQETGIGMYQLEAQADAVAREVHLEAVFDGSNLTVGLVG